MLRFVMGQHDYHTPLSRRDWLWLGSLTSLQTAANAWGCSRAAAKYETPPQGDRPGFGQARSVIVIFASGGQSQFDMWDPKPQAPAEVRGAFDAIPTSVPGTFLCEHMPQLARLADRNAILRSVSHEDLDHGSAAYLTLTGRYHTRRSSNPDPMPSDFPKHAAVLDQVRRSGRFPYSGVHINGPAHVPIKLAPGQNGGFLGRHVFDRDGGRRGDPGRNLRRERPLRRLSQEGPRRSLGRAGHHVLGLGH